tara:strand:- start:260 stop:1399 length:1140 start_codon:yes stop_codon:yes gene_type:complete
MSEIKVNSVKGVGASTAAITINNSDGTCTANITNKPNRNLIINGNMAVSQRGTSSTTSNDYAVDRFKHNFNGTDEAPTFAAVDLSTSDLPYTKGFTKALKVTNGNQTSGAGAADRIRIEQKVEAQNMRNSGWNYTSSSSYITLSFYVRSSISQNFYGRLATEDGTGQSYVYETGTLSANTWTKITKTVPGNSNLQFDNNNGTGLVFNITLFGGTDQTGTVTLNQWAAFNASVRSPDFSTSWYTTNDATFEMTGVQIEVGQTATDFEFKSYAHNLRECQRYYVKYIQQGVSGYIESSAATTAQLTHVVPVSMRANPSCTCTTATSIGVDRGGLYGINSTSGGLSWAYDNNLNVAWSMDTARTRWHTTWCRVQNVQFDAEL